VLNVERQKGRFQVDPAEANGLHPGHVPARSRESTATSFLFGVGEGPTEGKQESMGVRRKQFVRKSDSEQWILNCKLE
jgi:hypothetical protein